MTHTLAGALSRLTVAMIDVHERTCEIEGVHRWEACTSTPGIYAVADGLDLLDAAEFGKPDMMALVLALHDRQCGTDCGPETRVRHSDAWADQAGALLEFAEGEVDQPMPLEARSGSLLAMCVCGQIRRGHSVDGSRCYASPCSCAAEGGFRDRDRPDTWGKAKARALSLNPQDTGQQHGAAVERPDWFQHGD